MRKIKLSEWEIDLLPLSLVTTKKQGETIVERNKGLLKAVRKNVDYYARVGCPHCQGDNYGFNCSVCTWNTVKSSEGEKPCIAFRFDGVSLPRTSIDSAMAWGSDLGIGYGASFEKYSVIKNKVLRKRIFKFLKAHILWGKRIEDGTYKKYAEQEVDYE